MIIEKKLKLTTDTNKRF